MNENTTIKTPELDRSPPIPTGSDAGKSAQLDEQARGRLRTYAWGYFSFHADQRMKTFHFYIVVIAAVGAALIALGSQTGQWLWLAKAILCFTVGFLSLMFYLLDKRNRELVRNGERALRLLDQIEPLCREGTIPHDLEILAADDHQTKQKPRIPSLTAHYSFSWVIGMIFCWFGILSTAAGIICLLNGI
jgi:hypothetical protein